MAIQSYLEKEMFLYLITVAGQDMERQILNLNMERKMQEETILEY